MKVKFGAIVVDGSGKLGGHVFTKTKAGNAMRTKTTPVNRRSTAQQGVKSKFTANAQAFRALTAAQIAAWNVAAQDFKVKNHFGDSVTLSGMALYQRLNSNIVKAGGTIIADPPLQVAVPSVDDLVLATCTIAVMTATFKPTPTAATDVIIWEATRPLSAGVSFVKNQFRAIGITAAEGTSPADIYADYVAVFGAPVVGKKVWLRGTIINDETGQTGTPAQASFTVVE